MNPNENINLSALSPAEAVAKPKSNKPLIATAIATSVLALAGIGFGVYGMIDSNSKATEIANLKSQANSSNSTTPQSSGITAENYGFKGDNFAGSYTETISFGAEEETIPASVSVRTKFGAEVSLNANGSVQMSIIDEACGYYGDICGEYGNFVKNISSLISGRVVDISQAPFGNGGTSWLFFILEDGTVESLWEYDAIDNQQAETVENAQGMIHLFGKYAQDNTGKIYTISPVMDSSINSGVKYFEIND